MVYFRSVYNNLYALTVCSRCQITPLDDLNHSVDVIQNNNNNNKYKTVSTYKKRSFKRNLYKPKYRYDHKHYDDYLDSIEREHFQSGYTSEPDNIEYSIDRSWHNRLADLNQSLPDHLNNHHELQNTFQPRNFVKLPKLIYYDGVDHYSRPSLIN